MHIRTLISPLAVAAVLAFSSGASAQLMINGYQVPQESLSAFAQKCQALMVAQNRSLTTDVTQNEDPLATGSIPGQASPDPAAQENELQVLANLTIDQCREAGFL